MATLADLGERRVVGIVVGDGHLDLELVAELLDQVRAGVIAPVVDVQFAIGMRHGGGAEKGKRKRGKSQFLLHWLFSGYDVFSVLLRKKKIVTIAKDSSRNTVEIAFISGVTTRRSWPSM